MNKIKNGWLSQARKVISPHFDERPDVEDISLLVIHYISLPPASFRFHLAVDTLAIGYTIPAIRAC